MGDLGLPGIHPLLVARAVESGRCENVGLGKLLAFVDGLVGLWGIPPLFKGSGVCVATSPGIRLFELGQDVPGPVCGRQAVERYAACQELLGVQFRRILSPRGLGNSERGNDEKYDRPTTGRTIHPPIVVSRWICDKKNLLYWIWTRPDSPALPGVMLVVCGARQWSM